MALQSPVTLRVDKFNCGIHGWVIACALEVAVPVVVRSATLLALVACGTCAVAEDLGDSATPAPGTPRQADLNGLGVEPLYDLSTSDHELVMDLKAMLGYGYDSNLNATKTHSHPSSLIEGLAGMDLDWTPTQNDALKFSGDLDDIKYLAHTSRSLAGGKTDLDYRHSGTDWAAGGDANFSRTNDPYLITGQEIKHDTGHIGLDGTDHWSQDSGTVSLGVDRIAYLEAAPGAFNQDDLNSNDYTATLRFADQYSEALQAYVQAAFDGRIYDNKHRDPPSLIPGTDITTVHGYNNSAGVDAVVGLKDQLTTSSGLIAEVGVDLRRYKHSFAKDPSFNDSQVIKPALDVIYRWDWAPGSSLDARAYSSVIDSIYANAAWLYGAGVDARYLVWEEQRISLLGGLGLYQLKSSGSPDTVQQPNAEVRTTTELSGGAEYLIRSGVSARLTDVYDSSHSKYYNTFTRNVVEGELGFAF